MTADEPALLAAVCADPDADAPRLVYADWLDDHGDPHRAEFIRLGCEFAAALRDDARRAERGPLLGRTARLAREHGDRWRAELPADRAVRWGRFRRGFVAEAAVMLPGGLGRTAAGTLDPVFVAAPVQELRLSGNWDDLLFGVRHPRAGQLVRLELECLSPVPLGEVFFAALAAHPWPARLDELLIDCLVPPGLERLADAPPGQPFPRLVVRGRVDARHRNPLLARFGDRVEFRA